MASSIFLSYRRSDSQHATFGFADRLGWSFGRDEVFLDRGSIEPGSDWPQSIQQALSAAKVVLVIIGPGWLRSSDEWGRRRLDDPRDWVRREICAALEARRAGQVEVIPVYLDDVQVPPREALDGSLRPLLDIQTLGRLHRNSWEVDLEALLETISKCSRLTRQAPEGIRRYPNGSPARPEPKQTDLPTLSDEQVRSRLEPLGGWRLQWNAHPWGTGGRAQEIVKTYEFPSFRHAVDFMQRASRSIEEWTPPHHPRWENQWKVVTVCFSTWDVNCRVTELDIAAARKMDGLYYASFAIGPG